MGWNQVCQIIRAAKSILIILPNKTPIQTINNSPDQTISLVALWKDCEDKDLISFSISQHSTCKSIQDQVQIQATIVIWCFSGLSDQQKQDRRAYSPCGYWRINHSIACRRLLWSGSQACGYRLEKSTVKSLVHAIDFTCQTKHSNQRKTHPLQLDLHWRWGIKSQPWGNPYFLSLSPYSY